MKKRILSLILTVAMMLSVMTILPISVSAEEATFSTTQLQIKNLADFVAFNNLVDGGETFSGKTVELVTDVTLPADWNGIGAFGTEKVFSGTFEGNGHTITVSGTRGTGEDVGGVFDMVVNGTLQNFNVVGTLALSCNYFGGVIGGVGGDTTLKNLHVSVNIETNGKNAGRVGGIVATITKHIADSKLTFDGCVYDGTMNFSNQAYLNGGFLATTHQKGEDRQVIFKNCVYAGTMSFNDSSYSVFNGGFVGAVQYTATAEFTDCISVGKMTFKGGTYKDYNGVAVGLYPQDTAPISINNFYYVGFDNGSGGTIKAVSAYTRTEYTSGDYVEHTGSYGTATNVEQKTLDAIAALTASDFSANATFSFKANTDLDTYYPCPTGLVQDGAWVDSLKVSVDAKVLGARIRITGENDKYSGIRFEALFRETENTKNANTADANFGLILISKTAYEAWSKLEGEAKTFAALEEAGVVVNAVKATTEDSVITVKATVYDIDVANYKDEIVAVPFVDGAIVGDAVARSIYGVAEECVEQNNDTDTAIAFAKKVIKDADEYVAQQ